MGNDIEIQINNDTTDRGEEKTRYLYFIFVVL